jgi:hypothetical protein
MDGENEQRVSIKFYIKAGLFAIETLVLVERAYGSEAVSGSKVFVWYSRFRPWREKVEMTRELAVQNRLELRRSMKEIVIALPSAFVTLESITLNFWNYFIQPSKIMNFLTSLEK